MEPGACYEGNNRCTFTLWAPLARRVRLHLLEPAERIVGLDKAEHGYWRATVDDVAAGARYMYRVDEGPDRPDPAAHFQPGGVHHASAVVDHAAYGWGDIGWRGIRLEDMIIYELHVGTFSPGGTFAGVIERLGELRDLGVNAIEIMPVNQFPGQRNWGYDGVDLYAVQNSYGGPDGLKRLVDAAHQAGLAMILDVVYNHLGPEGNYLREFGPYFTDRHRTPWGDALNFDQPCSDGVREFFCENAVYWLREYHFDALRLDALHAIVDLSAKNFMAELAERVDEFSRHDGRKRYLIGESDLNDVRLIAPREELGYGLDAQWSDDFHHSVHALLTGERQGYYSDFGGIDDLVKALGEGFVYDWRYSRHRKRRHGSSSAARPSRQLVVCIQNHDQVGNRMLGDRMAQTLDFESLKLAAATLLLSPYVPMLFMGEEYGEESPFQYFVSHGDRDLVEAVRQGRQREFEAFEWSGTVPDPQAIETFERSRLDWSKRTTGRHGTLLDFYRRLIELRRKWPDFTSRQGFTVENPDGGKVITWRRRSEGRQWLCYLNYANEPTSVILEEGNWQVLLNSSAAHWHGPGPALPERITGGRKHPLAPHCAVLLEKPA